MTERLGPTTFKLPSLRPDHDRVTREGLAFDPHGFPMSERLASCQTERGRGVHMNITARMMAVQAPGNWTKAESEAFFTRHFYRALLQRIFLDRGIVNRPSLGDDENTPKNVIIGSLRKASYASFGAYVHGAVAKLSTHHEQGAWIAERMAGLSPADIETYEQAYAARKHELSFVWSLMAFSATAAESLVVVDRWCWLKEQEEVERCWVEAVFGYETSPRNLVVVGVKKGKRQKDRCNLSDPDWQ
ncbi:MAG: hypothetical protein M1832_004468 [Thelocarpon impressellum]|nr:MAG: hypothetical protein M1832_004468 [Thelocarpon impressellum]